jgi:hypothetical protein
LPTSLNDDVDKNSISLLISVTLGKTLIFLQKTTQVGAELNETEHYSTVPALPVARTIANDGYPIWKNMPYTS